ncbi:MAG: UvrB/UvrC motif-containing protein [Chlamydiales bacterium]|nr:UvrB/UvrC motif-containing protein [Chlamydiales bacterium]
MSDRPLECVECKKPIKVCYTEIIGDTIVKTSMCADCPELQRRLHGIPATTQLEQISGRAGLCCGSCGTTLDAIKQGAPLGCSECYEVFGDVIAADLIISKAYQREPLKDRKSKLIHLGRSPGETGKLNPALRLLALNDALTETLTREDYEQAALLRDQIKELTEKSDSEKKDVDKQSMEKKDNGTK